VLRRVIVKPLEAHGTRTNAETGGEAFAVAANYVRRCNFGDPRPCGVNSDRRYSLA
jgi:hypothetical protein